jgi:predicted ATPase
MKVTFKKLGPVKSATIDLSKDLIILTGPNNTGKTYVAYALYGLCSYRNFLEGYKPFSVIIDRLVEDGEYSFDFDSFLIESLDDFLADLSRQFEKYLPSVLASGKLFFNGFKLKIKAAKNDILSGKNHGNNIRQQLVFGKNKTVFFEKQAFKLNLKMLYSKTVTKDSDENQVTNNLLKKGIVESLSLLISEFIFPDCFIAPAERIAINIFSKELSLKRNALVDELIETRLGDPDQARTDLLLKKVSRYSLPIRDSLVIAEDMTHYAKKQTSFTGFAELLEDKVLNGKVDITEEVMIQFRPVGTEALEIPIHLSATSIKSLSNLIIYLRHAAKAGDFIIIDEPELNLHPDNQVSMARFIARLVNGGFKVMISTHSDYIIRELNNLIIGNKKKNIALDELGYQKEELLDYRKVEAILFQQNKTTNIDVQDDGFDVKTIDETIDAINMRAQKLYFGE